MEVWRIQGSSGAAWDECLAGGSEQASLLQEVARALPPKTARALLKAAAETLQEAANGRAG
eukprot:1770442-Pyramimonas_sp.AAC.1